MKKISDIVTLEKLAEEMDVGVETIQKWREMGMPTIKIDKFIRAYRPAVAEWLVKTSDKSAVDDRQTSLFGKNGLRPGAVSELEGANK